MFGECILVTLGGECPVHMVFHLEMFECESVGNIVSEVIESGLCFCDSNDRCFCALCYM